MSNVNTDSRETVANPHPEATPHPHHPLWVSESPRHGLMHLTFTQKNLCVRRTFAAYDMSELHVKPRLGGTCRYRGRGDRAEYYHAALRRVLSRLWRHSRRHSLTYSAYRRAQGHIAASLLPGVGLRGQDPASISTAPSGVTRTGNNAITGRNIHSQ